MQLFFESGNSCSILNFSIKADSAVLHFCKKCYTLGQHFQGYPSGLPFIWRSASKRQPKKCSIALLLLQCQCKKSMPNSVARNIFQNIGHFDKKHRKYRAPIFIAFLCDNFWKNVKEKIEIFLKKKFKKFLLQEEVKIRPFSAVLGLISGKFGQNAFEMKYRAFSEKYRRPIASKTPSAVRMKFRAFCEISAIMATLRTTLSSKSQ